MRGLSLIFTPIPWNLCLSCCLFSWQRIQYIYPKDGDAELLLQSICTTKLAQTTFKYYFVLQSLHQVLPCTTLYYKACTKYFPVLLCTTKLAQNTSQYYFVLQSLCRLASCNLAVIKIRSHTEQKPDWSCLTSFGLHSSFFIRTCQ